MEGVQLNLNFRQTPNNFYSISGPLKYLGHTHIKKLFVVYLELKFNWVSCILLGSPKYESLGLVCPPCGGSLVPMLRNPDCINTFWGRSPFSVWCILWANTLPCSLGG